MAFITLSTRNNSIEVEAFNRLMVENKIPSRLLIECTIIDDEDGINVFGPNSIIIPQELHKIVKDAIK
jgi:hypothetical protein